LCPARGYGTALDGSQGGKMKKFLALSAVVVVVFALGYVAHAAPAVAFGDSPVSLGNLVPFIRSGGGVPSLFDAQSTGHGVLYSEDLGVNPGQIAVVFGYAIQYRELSAGSLELASDGTVTGGGCAIVAFFPGFYRNLVILDGRREVYNLPGINAGFWQKKLVVDRVAEQASHYECSTALEDVPLWNEDGTASPFLSAVTASVATVAPTASAAVEAEAATPAATAQDATPAALERRVSGDNLTIRFSAGETVYGWKIVMDNGAICDLGECYLPSAPTGGQVTSGVVNPWENEVPSSTQPWDGLTTRPAG